jgi:hypothetical protein
VGDPASCAAKLTRGLASQFPRVPYSESIALLRIPRLRRSNHRQWSSSPNPLFRHLQKEPGSPPVNAPIRDFPRNSLKTLAKNIHQVCRSFPASSSYSFHDRNRPIRAADTLRRPRVPRPGFQRKIAKTHRKAKKGASNSFQWTTLGG